MCLEPKWPGCFDWKRLCFGRLTFKNRGHCSSRYTYRYIIYIYIYNPLKWVGSKLPAPMSLFLLSLFATPQVRSKTPEETRIRLECLGKIICCLAVPGICNPSSWKKPFRRNKAVLKHILKVFCVCVKCLVKLLFFWGGIPRLGGTVNSPSPLETQNMGLRFLGNQDTYF